MDGSGGHIGSTRQILPCVKKEISSEVWRELNFIQFQATIELKLNWHEIDVNSSIFLTHCNYLLLWHYNWHQKASKASSSTQSQLTGEEWKPKYAFSLSHFPIYILACHLASCQTLCLGLCVTLITCVLHLAHCPRCKRTRRAACLWSPRRRWRGTPSCTPPPSPPPPASPPGASSHRLPVAL